LPTKLPLYSGATTSAVSAWTVQPAVAVSRSGDTWSRPMAQLAQVPQLGWASDDDGERLAHVVDRLLLESLLVHFYRRFAPLLALEYGEPSNDPRELVILTWVPDPWTLAELIKGLRKAPRREGTPEGAEARWRIAYPGHGLRAAELAQLRDLLSIIEGGVEDRSELISQERLREVDLDLAAVAGRTVALSGWAEDADVAGAGLGAVHVQDLVVRLARRLAEAKVRIVFEELQVGEARRTKLRQRLIEVVQGWQAASPSSERSADPLVSYLPWPASVTKQTRARLRGLCKLVPIDAPNVEPTLRAASAEADTQRAVSGAVDARIIVAGPLEGWQGWLPNVLGEIAAAVEASTLPLIVGGFGGAAGLVAEFLSDEEAEWPPTLTYAHAAVHQRELQRLIGASMTAAEEAQRRFDEAIGAVRRFRRMLHSEDEWPFGDNQAEVHALLRASSPTSVIHLVLASLSRLATQDTPE